MAIVTSTEMQNNFGKYLKLAVNGEDIVVMKNGKPAARLISNEKSVSFLTDTIRGVLLEDYDYEQMRDERYGSLAIADEVFDYKV